MSRDVRNYKDFANFSSLLSVGVDRAVAVDGFNPEISVEVACKFAIRVAKHGLYAAFSQPSESFCNLNLICLSKAVLVVLGE